MKLMIFGRRAPGKSRAACHRHLRDVHGQMVVAPPQDAGAMPGDYVQNHVLDGAYPAATGAHSVERDLVTEIWFTDIDHMRASMQTPYYLTRLKPDERHFVDDATVEKAPVQPVEIGGGDRAGPFKCFVGLGFLPGTASDQDAAIAATAGALAGLSGVARVERNIALPGPGGAVPFVGQVFACWFPAREAAAAVFDILPDLLVGPVDPAGSFAVIAEQHDTARLRART